MNLKSDKAASDKRAKSRQSKKPAQATNNADALRSSKKHKEKKNEGDNGAQTGALTH